MSAAAGTVKVLTTVGQLEPRRSIKSISPTIPRIALPKNGDAKKEKLSYAKKAKFDTCGMPKRQIEEAVQRPFGGCTGDAAGNKFRSRSIGEMPLGLGRL